MQYEELVKYMESHSEFAASKYLSKEGKIHHIQQWEDLTNMLNALSNGTGKTVKQWQTVWRDLKSNTSKKASKLRNERNRTGNFPVTADPLDNLEKRITSIIGLEYIQGTNCPDSFPEEEHLQLQLEKGNRDVLQLPPSTTSINELINVPREDMYDSDNYMNELLQEERAINQLESNDGEQAIEMDQRTSNKPTGTKRKEASNGMSQRNKDISNDNHVDELLQEETENNELQFNEVVQAMNQHTPNKPTGTRRKEAPNRVQKQNKEHSSKNSSQRISVQLKEARNKFTEIAESHAKALLLFAEASMKHANAAMIGAENDRVRNELEEQRLLLEERRLNMDEKLIITFNDVHKLMEKILLK